MENFKLHQTGIRSYHPRRTSHSRSFVKKREELTNLSIPKKKKSGRCCTDKLFRNVIRIDGSILHGVTSIDTEKNVGVPFCLLSLGLLFHVTRTKSTRSDKCCLKSLNQPLARRSFSFLKTLIVSILSSSTIDYGHEYEANFIDFGAMVRSWYQCMDFVSNYQKLPVFALSRVHGWSRKLIRSHSLITCDNFKPRPPLIPFLFYSWSRRFFWRHNPSTCDTFKPQPPLIWINLKSFRTQKDGFMNMKLW